MSNFNRASVRSVSPIVSGTRTIVLETYFPYKPGQAVQVKFPNDVKPKYFSLCSSPTEVEMLSIAVKAPEGSPLSSDLKALKPGSMLEVNGPWGSFALPDTLPDSICFLGAGTGVAPFRSMAKYLLDHDTSTATLDMRLMHSVRSEDDLLFRSEFESWKSPRFIYTPIITGDAPAWSGAKGRMNASHIQSAISKKHTTFFLCGPSGFVADTEKLLKNTLQIAPEHIRREQW